MALHEPFRSCIADRPATATLISFERFATLVAIGKRREAIEVSRG
jgi:hypothetical protein